MELGETEYPLKGRLNKLKDAIGILGEKGLTVLKYKKGELWK